MAWPRDVQDARRVGRELLERRMKGNLSGMESRRHIHRAERVAELIYREWESRGPFQWQEKHVRWVLTEPPIGVLGAHARNRYWKTVVILLEALQKPHWLAALDGPWVRASGERGKLKVAGRRRKYYATVVKDLAQRRKNAREVAGLAG